MSIKRILDLLSGRGLQSFPVGIGESGEGRRFKAIVSCKRRSVVRTLMVVGDGRAHIQPIHRVSAGEMFLGKVRRPVGLSAVFANDVKRLMRVVTRVACRQRASTTTMTRLASYWGIGRRCSSTATASTSVIQLGKGGFAILGEWLRAATWRA